MNKKELLKNIKGKTLKEIIQKVCDKKIGSGAYRDVYSIIGNDKYVIKIERNMSNGQFANVCEWRNYIDSKDWEFLSNRLAPCIAINETGQVLIQQKTTKGKRKDYPKYIPFFFTDLKLSNFGFINNRFVCHDYSTFLTYEIEAEKMKYAKWWGSIKD